ncbi:MAG: hypothetical protein IKB25_08275 [Lentisphaeria bacterium]|nr:hypothetical protein [Lentisphaeria bacterium]
MLKKLLVAGMVFSAIVSLSAQTKDFRPKFDKSGMKGYVTTQANPWFPFNKPRIHALGGPNYARKEFLGGNVWGQGLQIMQNYGFDVVYIEINDGLWYKTLVGVLKQAKDMNLKIKIGMFAGINSKTPDAAAKKVIGHWRNFKDDIKNHPNLYRVDGRPVVLIYTPTRFKPEQWKIFTDAMEREFGPMIFLANLRGLPGALASDKVKLTDALRKYMPYFDGISNYGSSGVENQRVIAEAVAPIMHKEFPQKIYEGCVHSTYTCHFHMGGLSVDLSKYYRQSFDIMTKAKPDSINITNLFDHYENSLIFPCYEREDFMVRYAQYWNSTQPGGEAFPKQKFPELVVTNNVMTLLGREDVNMEVIGFPFEAKNTKVKVQLDLCETSGKIIKSFPEEELDLSKTVQVRRYSFPAMDAVKYRGVVPRLNYTWGGKKYKMNYNPMTLISAGIKPYHMWWARSTKNALQVRFGNEPWFMGGVGPGGTLAYPEGGIVNFMGSLKPTWNFGSPVSSYSRYSIKRNGNEFYTSREGTNHLKMNLALPLPASGEALQYFYLEMENPEGARHQTLPIWVAPPNRKGMVKVPVFTKDKKIVDVEIEAFRVPYFYYPCETNAGNLLLDVSGYVHNGNIAGAGYGGGHLGHTGYYYYHNGPIAPKTGTKFLRDENGKGFYRFEGKDAVTIMGGTIFPYAITLEASVRFPKFGKVMGIFGSAKKQLDLSVLPNGKLYLVRQGVNKNGKPYTAEIVTRTKLKPDTWYRIAVTYDLKKLRIYINGKLEKEAEVYPTTVPEWGTHLIVGGLCKWVWDPIEKMTGDIREIRIYGRNLSPEEFLK